MLLHRLDILLTCSLHVNKSRLYQDQRYGKYLCDEEHYSLLPRWWSDLTFVEGVAEFDRLQSPDMMTPSRLSWRKVLSLRNGNILGLCY